MADIKAFRALRYDPDKVNPAEAVTQPYDKITPAMQDKYYSVSDYNLVRIILGRAGTSDSDADNVYTRAAGFFQDWRAKGVLRPDARESIYYYTQRFTIAAAALGHTGAPVELERRGFIALGRIHDYSDGVVFRHEQTLAKPRSDRLNLLRATKAHFGQIFMLYSDPAGEIDLLLENSVLTVMPGATRQSEADAALSQDPDISVTDEYGVLHRVWAVSHPQVVKAVIEKMRDKKLLIADGHHRYETALTYRDERRKAAGGSVEAEAPYERVMMTFVNMDSRGLVILPTHRVVHSLKSFDREKFLEGARKYFEVVPSTGRCEETLAKLHEAGKHGTALMVASGDECFLLHARAGAADGLLGGVAPLQRQLDMVQLHKVLLEHVLGLSEESIRNQENISYHRDAEEVLRRVREGANLACLMNPIKMEQLREVTFAGGVLPQKSTDFYPKLLSGLTVYPLE